jgi:preprotein translocase subunit Sec61beta
MEAAQALAGDPDIVLALAGAVGVAIEAAYTIAKRRGWAL